VVKICSITIDFKSIVDHGCIEPAKIYCSAAFGLIAIEVCGFHS